MKGDDQMQAVRLSLPLCFISLSVLYALAIARLPEATLGDPNAPSYFPIAICAGLLLFSIIDFIQVVKRRNARAEEDLLALVKKQTLAKITVVSLLCVGYTLLFDYAGFLLATVLFLGALLFYLNGKEKWLANLLVTIIVSFSIWYIFSQLLEISLPSLGG